MALFKCADWMDGATENLLTLADGYWIHADPKESSATTQVKAQRMKN